MGGIRFIGTVMLTFYMMVVHTARADTLVHGPYLQRPSESSMTVRWRTDIAHAGTLYVGTTATNLGWVAAESSGTTEHELTASGLQPATEYYYAIGYGTNLLASGVNYRFNTSPSSSSMDAFRVWVLGDPGTGSTNAQAVYNAYLAYTGTNRTDLVLALGDNAYNWGTDAEFHDKFFTIYPSILQTTPVFPCFGNHDGVSSDSSTQTGPYYDLFSLPANGESGGIPSGTEAYYSYDHGNAHFISLDSTESDRTTNGAMYAWLVSDLASCTSAWIIAYWHHPPYTMGSYDSDVTIQLVQMRQNLVPLLEQHGVDLVLCGHSHVYEQSFLMDGHYGYSTNYDFGVHALNQGNGQKAGDGAYMKPSAIKAGHSGTVYVVCGTSGSVIPTVKGTHPAMETSIREMGSVVLDIASNRLDMVFLSKTGVVLDSFSIVKGEDDYDGDGMPDLWEQETFRIGVAPHDNADNDAQDNLGEYIAGTNPTDPSSFFRIATNHMDGAGFVLRWDSVSNRSYNIRWAATPTHAMSNIATQLTYPANAYTDTVHFADDAGFYRLEVGLME